MFSVTKEGHLKSVLDEYKSSRNEEYQDAIIAILGSLMRFEKDRYSEETLKEVQDYMHRVFSTTCFKDLDINIVVINMCRILTGANK